jgi:hypothetical protein
MLRVALFLSLGVLVAATVFFFDDIRAYTRTAHAPEREISPSLHDARGAQGVGALEVPLVRDQLLSETNPKSRYIYNVHTPEILLLDDPARARDTTAVLRTVTNDIIAHFISDAHYETSATQPSSAGSNLAVSFTPLLLSPTIISIRFDIAEYFAGSAHPNSHVFVFNFDMNAKRTLETAELFASSSVALPFLSEKARAKLKDDQSGARTPLDEALIISGTEPILGNFTQAGITKEGLVVFFDPMTVLPYARGEQTVHISLQDARPYLAEGVREAITQSTTNFREATPENEKSI